MKYPKRSQYKHAKSRYRVSNWAEYEAGLRSRGDLTIWLTDDALDAWQAVPSGKPGGQRTYTDIAIEAALTIRQGLPPSAPANGGLPTVGGPYARGGPPGPRPYDAVPAAAEARRDPISQARDGSADPSADR